MLSHSPIGRPMFSLNVVSRSHFPPSSLGPTDAVWEKEAGGNPAEIHGAIPGVWGRSQKGEHSAMLHLLLC